MVTTTKLMTKVVTAATTTITDVAPITAATINAASSAARRRKGVVIKEPEETDVPSIIIHSDPKSKDKGKRIMVEEPKPLKKQAQIKLMKEKEDNVVLRYQALKRKPQTEAQARKNMMIYLRNMVGFIMDYFKGMSYDDIRLIFEKALKRKTESLEEKAANKQKLDEEVLVVDYAIHTENNKPYYKIIRANRSHQLFLSFLSLLRNFDREDLEVLWQLVKERFASSKPKNFSDDFLLTTLRYMFEKPDVEAQVWKNQRGVHDDLAGRMKISIDKVHFRADAKQSLELVLLKNSKIYTKRLLLVVKDLLLLEQVDAVR
nr:hypothetical protein [Tanacetum cinerariifolium]